MLIMHNFRHRAALLMCSASPPSEVKELLPLRTSRLKQFNTAGSKRLGCKKKPAGNTEWILN